MSGHSHFDTDSQIYTLISIPKYLIVYLAFLRECLTNISNIVCAKQNSYCPFLSPSSSLGLFLFSINDTTINPVAQAQTSGVMLIPLSLILYLRAQQVLWASSSPYICQFIYFL